MSEVSCPRCNRANPSNHFFCTECGANLRITDVEDRERRSLARELESVRWQLNGASRELDRLQVRISRLEGGPAIPTQPQPPVQDDQAPARPQPPASQPEAQPADIPRDRSPVSEGPAYRLHGPLSPSSASVTRAANAGEALGGPSSGSAAGVPNSTGGISFGSSIDWEHVLGRNWFAIIGAVSLVLGLGFFLKLSFDNNWIGDTGRIVLGIAAGMALLGTGEYAQRRVPLWAQAVTAGGAAILYLSIYSAFALYQLIRPDVALLFLAVVVGLAGLLAIRYDSIVIGFLGIIGAFIAPVLLGPELLDIRLALPYILIVDLGILWVATFRNWRWFVLMGWIGSYGLFAAALDQFPGYEPILMQAGLTAMFLIFVGATTLFHILWRRVPGPLDMSIVAINGTAFFALTVAILWEDYQVWFGLISLSLSLLYGLIAYAALKRPGAPTEIAMIALPMALVFLTVAVPMQLSGVWLTTAWAAQGVALVWTGFLLYKTSMRIFGLGALALAAGYLLLFGASVDLNSFVPVMNERFLIFVVVIIAFYAAGYLFWRNRDLDEEWEESMPPILLTVASGLTLGLLSMEAVDYFSSRYDGFVAQQSATNGTLLSLTAIWSTYAFLLMAVGLKWRLPLARWGGIGLAGAAMLKLLAFDTFVVRLDPLTSVSVLNSHFLTFVIVLAPMVAIYYWSRRERALLPGLEITAFRILLIAINVVALWGMSLEGIRYFDRALVRIAGMAADQNAINGTFLTLTALWSIYASILLAVGLRWRLPLARMGGMALMAAAALKLLLVDTFVVKLAPLTFVPVLNPHFLTFVLALALLIAVAYLFRKERADLPEIEAEAFRALLIAINAVALWGMSQEAIHYFDSLEITSGMAQVSAKHLTLTVLWAVYGIAAIGVGIVRQSSRIRLAGMALLALPVIKLFGFDVFLLEQGYRVAAFVTLGVLLLGTGLAYQRYSQALREFLFREKV